jgi:hypothetical protein
MIPSLQIPTELIEPISKAGANDVTGWGIALLLSLCFNYFIYKEFKFIQQKFLEHLSKVSETLDSISNHIFKS